MHTVREGTGREGTGVTHRLGKRQPYLVQGPLIHMEDAALDNLLRCLKTKSDLLAMERKGGFSHVHG